MLDAVVSRNEDTQKSERRKTEKKLSVGVYECLCCETLDIVINSKISSEKVQRKKRMRGREGVVNC